MQQRKKKENLDAGDEVPAAADENAENENEEEDDDDEGAEEPLPAITTLK